MRKGYSFFLLIAALSTLSGQHTLLQDNITYTETLYLHFQTTSCADTVVANLIWDVGKTALNEYSTLLIDDAINVVKQKQIKKISVHYWDYDLSVFSSFLFKRRSESIYEYISSKLCLIEIDFISHYEIVYDETTLLIPPYNSIERSLLFIINNESEIATD